MAKFVFRFVPYYEYDIRALENWLSEMAEKGLLFKNFIFGLARFEKTEPVKNARFRFIPEPKGTGLFCENVGEPESEFREMSENSGWKYITGRNDFHIFYTDDENAFELATDDEVTAMAVDEVKKRKRNTFTGSLVYVAVYTFIVSRLAGTLIMPMILIGTPLFVLLVFLVTAEFVEHIKRIIYLNRLSKALRDGNIENPDKMKYGFSGIFKTVMLILSVICLVCLLGAALPDIDETKITDYSADIPFATIDDLICGEYMGLQFDFGDMNTIDVKSDVLAPVIIDYSESADVILEDGRDWYGSLYITYVEFRSEKLAEIAAKEIVRIDKMRKGEFAYVDIPDVNADFSVGYLYDELRLADTPTIVIRQGNKVMRMNLYQFTENDVDIENWLNTAAQLM